jgi:hypothetical protein
MSGSAPAGRPAPFGVSGDPGETDVAAPSSNHQHHPTAVPTSGSRRSTSELFGVIRPAPGDLSAVRIRPLCRKIGFVHPTGTPANSGLRHGEPPSRRPAGLRPHPNRAARLYLLSEASISIFGRQNGVVELKEDWR